MTSRKKVTPAPSSAAQGTKETQPNEGTKDNKNRNESKERPSTEHAPPPKPNNHAALDFLQRWKPDGPWALTAIRPDKKMIHGRLFREEQFQDMDKWIKEHNGKFNMYFSVNTVMREFQQKASRADIKSLDWLHVDIDARPPNPDWTAEEVEAHTRREFERIYELLTNKLPQDIPKPSAVTYSGGGYQAFWRLKEAAQIDGDEARYEDAKLYNVQLERVFEGDNCHNVDRIMRLPGTINIPDAKKLKKGRKPALAVVKWFVTDIAYPLSAFTKASQPTADAAGEAQAEAPIPSIEVVRIATLDELAPYSVPNRLLVIIARGHHPDEPKKDDNSRSSWLMDVTCNLFRLRVPESIIRGILTDPGWGISASVLDKGSGQGRYLDRQIARAKEIASGDPAAIALHEMNDLHAVIDNYGNNTRVMTEGPPRPFFQKFGDFNNRYMNKFVQVGTDKDNKPIWMPRGKWWLLQAGRRQYQRVEFVPGGELPECIYNLWRGFAARAVRGSCSQFLALLKDIICAGNEAHSEWLLNWMAHAIQRPQEPGEVAVVLRGGQGLGKSFFAEHFGELFGRHFVPVTDPKHVIGNFNNMLHDALLVFSDEAFAANDKRAEGILKGLVTQSHITIEPKGVDAFKALKFFRMLLASNNSWVVPADTDDRRFFVLDVSIAHKYDTAYFAAIDAEWKSGGREALMHLLLHRNISGFDHRHRPETAALVDQKIHSLRGAQRIVYEMLASGDPPVAKADKERVFISTRDLRRDTQAKCSETALGRELKKMADNKKGDRLPCGDERKKGYWLPRLSEARRRWAEETKLEMVPWPRDDGEWASSTDLGDINVAIVGNDGELRDKAEKPPF